MVPHPRPLFEPLSSCSDVSEQAGVLSPNEKEKGLLIIKGEQWYN